MVVQALKREDNRSTSGRKTGSGRKSTSGKATEEGRGKAPQRPQPVITQWEAFVRGNPVLDRYLDGTLVLGDLVMVAATELSSERLPSEGLPVLLGGIMASWLLAGGVLGDYKGEAEDHDLLGLTFYLPIFMGIGRAGLTWALAVLATLPLDAYLVSHSYLDGSWMMDTAGDGVLAPQMEVNISLLITMTCWRGIVAKLRYMS